MFRMFGGAGFGFDVGLGCMFSFGPQYKQLSACNRGRGSYDPTFQKCDNGCVIRFDPTLSRKAGLGQKFKDWLGCGGHVYGYGCYFAQFAIYSHWWYTRVWTKKKLASRSACWL